MYDVGLLHFLVLAVHLVKFFGWIGGGVSSKTFILLIVLITKALALLHG